MDGLLARVYTRLPMPDILVNGEHRTICAGATVGALLQELGLLREQVAVERNREIVPRSSYDEAGLDEGDTLEIVTFVGGG